jgi:hypothetical protein
MTETIEFVPTGDMPSPQKSWWLLILMNVVFDFVSIMTSRHHTYSPLIFPVVFFVLTFGMTLTVKKPLKITLSKMMGTIQYDYVTLFGKQKQITVDVKTAYYTYKLNISKSTSNMRLLIYNNYFVNRIDLKAAGGYNFTKEQLDAMVLVIKGIRGETE